MSLPEDSWSAGLAATLAQLTGDYRTLRGLADGNITDESVNEIDQRDAQIAATACAAQALSSVIRALSELPSLARSFRDDPLSDLLAAMDDLRRGLSPNLLRPAHDKAGQLSTKTDMLKLRAAASVFVLKRSGAADADARRQVATIFSAAGHRGKKGGAVSASTIFTWCLDCHPDLQGSVHQRLIAEMLDRLPDVLTPSAAMALVRAEAAKRL